MKLTKSDSQLNEKDAIQDMLESEKQLISFYATALFEGSSKSVRKEFSTNLMAVANNQYSLFNQMSTRGYYQPSPAQKQMIDQTNDTFKKQAKQLKAN
jgi:spore coat protein CotF